MASIETVRIVDKDVPGGRLINKADFKEKEHVLFREKKGGRGAASDDGDEDEDQPDPRAERAKELGGMKADKLRKLAVAAGLEPGTKEENIAAILAAEYPA